MEYQIMKDGKLIAEFIEEADAKKFLTEKQEEYFNDKYSERLHSYMEHNNIQYSGNVSMMDSKNILKQLRDESEQIFQLNVLSADRSVDWDKYASSLVDKITPIFEKARAVMDEEMAETEEGSTYYEYEDGYLELHNGINSFLNGGSEAEALLNDCFNSDGDSKLEDMLISIRKMDLADDKDVYPVLDSVRDLKMDYRDIKKNKEISFPEQVDKSIKGEMPYYNALKVCDTPQILLDAGCDQLPMLYTQKHLKDALHIKSEKNSHWHGLTLEQIKSVPVLLASPVMIFDSTSTNKGTKKGVIAVLNATDNDNAPLIVSIIPNGSGVYELKKVNSNYIASIYGKEGNFEKFIENAALSQNMLYWNKNKSQELFSCLGLSLPEALNKLDYDVIIRKSQNIVNSSGQIYKNNQNKQIDEITERLEQGIAEVFNSERYKEYLQVMSKFHNYSFNNTMLIAMQKPDASLVAGYNAWKNKFGRNVMKGEKGIRILAPAPYTIHQSIEKKDPQTGKTEIGADGNPVMETREVQIPSFKVVSVFDVSQTEGRELPDPVVSELTGDVEEYEKFYAALEKTSPVPMDFEKIEGSAHGYYSQTEKHIVINEGMSELQTLKTAIHEIAHAKLHDIDLNILHSQDSQDRPDRRTREVQAESIAYTVCQHYGLDTSEYSFGYIADWSSGRELPELKASLETIRNTASELIKDIDKNFAELTQDKEQTQEAQVGESIPENKQPQPERDIPQEEKAATKEPTVTILWSEHGRFHDGEILNLSEANDLIESLDKATVSEEGYYKTKFRIDFVMNGKPDNYVGRQDLGDGDGTLIEHIEKYHAYYENNEQWDNYLLRNGNMEALEADKAQREMLLHEFVPYLKMHNNLSKMERIATKALENNSGMTTVETAYHTAMREYVSKCRTMLNSGDYNLPSAPQLKDFDTELAAYKEHVKKEIAQEAAAAGMTVKEYAANGYEPYSMPEPETFTECKDKGSWAEKIEKRKTAALNKESNTTPQEQIHKKNFEK